VLDHAVDQEMGPLGAFGAQHRFDRFQPLARFYRIGVTGFDWGIHELKNYLVGRCVTMRRVPGQAALPIPGQPPGMIRKMGGRVKQTPSFPSSPAIECKN
jgi:hypothetical protein